MQKVVVVTGSSGGIGTEICKLFKKKGWFVVGLDITQSKTKHVDRFFLTDLAVDNAIKSTVNMIENEIGRIDSVVNNAAYAVYKPIIETSTQNLKKTLDCNLVAPFLLAKYCYKLLKNNGGNIVNISSVHCATTSCSAAAYACSKAALTGLTKNMALEFAKDGIRVNCVSPGAIDTQMLRDGLGRGHVFGSNTHELVDNLGKKCPIGFVGLPEDVANLVYFLADNNKSRNITGANMFVDGGASVKLCTE